MATTAKPVRSGKFADNGEEDIAAIAKQISDHAEAIYQTWKARGLAPSEILSCHSGPADTFGSTLGTTNASNHQRSSMTSPSPQVSVELLAQAPEMSNNNLEKLVNNFVVEDKARVAAARHNASKNLPSSIQYALQKFENPIRTPSPINVVRKETVEMQMPKEVPLKKPAKPIKPAGLTVTERPAILQSWPLKNKPSERANVANKGAALLLDEVSREEERLINALKSGTVIGDEIKKESFTKPTALKEISSTPSVDQTDRVRSANLLNENIVWKNGPPAAKVRSDAPHPEVTAANQRTAGHHLLRTGSPVRPFLTRGSVAERVLIFEKCPSELRAPRLVQREPVIKPQVKPQPKPLPPHTTLQRSVKGNRNVFIPKFYYPLGKPVPQSTLDGILHRIQSAFNTFPNSQVPRDSFQHVVSACGLPMYWKAPLYLATQPSPTGHVDGHRFIDFWKKMVSSCHDPASRFIHILTRGNRARPWLCAEDLAPLVQDVVERHPGLAFLRAAQEFHSRYVHTVIARIFYCVNRSWSGRITVAELRRSDLLQVIQLLEEEEDINQITAYFSYEHFYVIYCKFWELDRDHDLYIDKQDLARHNDHALSSRMIERIFSGCVTRGGLSVPGSLGHSRMSYTEFVWFLLAEEDKTHPTAIEYWFRCMDLDGDGVLSMYELEYFYEEQTHRMESIGIETLPFEDCLCQMLDMIRPSRPGCVSLSDLKRCKMTPIFFDTFFNLEKYLDHEQRDPFANQREQDGDELSDWDRFAAEEYELLVAEEGADAQDQGSYDEDDTSLKLDNLDAELGLDDSVDQGGYGDSISTLVTPNLSSLFEIYRNQHGTCYSKNEPNIRNNGIENNAQYNGYNTRNYVNERRNKVYDMDDEDYARDSDDCSI